MAAETITGEYTMHKERERPRPLVALLMTAGIVTIWVLGYSFTKDWRIDDFFNPPAHDTREILTLIAQCNHTVSCVCHDCAIDQTLPQ